MSPITPADVVAVYEQVLGRTPTPEDVAHQAASAGSLADLLAAVVASDEYRSVVAPGTRPAAGPPARPRVNIFHPDLADHGHPVGTLDADGIAVVGREGWLFLRGGTNLNLPQYLGELAMAPGWLEGWRDALELRRREATALGAAVSALIVPDKLAAYEEHFPEPLPKRGLRPIELLQEAGLPLLYPLRELRDAARRAPVYLRTDTHLSVHGNQVLFDVIADDLGLDRRPPHLDPAALQTYVTSGDLGRRFDPQIVDVITSVGSFGNAQVTEDNRADMAAVGGHLGTRRVFVNDRAPDPRTAVLYGDSFGFGDGSYQGISWFMAQTFRETHFVWVPLGWDPAYAKAVGAQVVVFESAERFMGRVPKPAVDVREIAEETLRRKAGLDLGVAFGSG